MPIFTPSPSTSSRRQVPTPLPLLLPSPRPRPPSQLYPTPSTARRASGDSTGGTRSLRRLFRPSTGSTSRDSGVINSCLLSILVRSTCSGMLTSTRVDRRVPRIRTLRGTKVCVWTARTDVQLPRRSTMEHNRIAQKQARSVHERDGGMINGRMRYMSEYLYTECL